MSPPPEYPASTMRPSLDLHPGGQPVGEAEPARRPPRLEVVDRVGGWIVVARDAGVERALEDRAGDRLRRDPRHARHRRLDPHGPTSPRSYGYADAYGRDAPGGEGAGRPTSGGGSTPDRQVARPPCRPHEDAHGMERHGGRPDHRVPRRRQRDRPRRRARAPRARARPRGRRHGDDYDSLLAGAEAVAPQVLVTDIRMPPTFQREGIDAAKELRKRHPGTGVVVLSQYDDPDYAIALLGDGAAGYAYLLKDRVGEGDQLARAVREVATGGSVLDPKIVEALVAPGHRRRRAHRRRRGAAPRGRRGPADQGDRRPSRDTTAADGGRRRSRSSSSSSRRARAPAPTGALKRLRMLHTAIVDREEQGERLSRLLPGGLADKVRNEGASHRRDRGARRHRAHGRHPRVLGDRRAHRPDPARAAAQRAPGRDEPRDPRRGRHRHAVRRRRGDGVLRRAGAARRSRRPRGARGRARCSSASVR